MFANVNASFKFLQCQEITHERPNGLEPREYALGELGPRVNEGKVKSDDKLRDVYLPNTNQLPSPCFTTSRHSVRHEPLRSEKLQDLLSRLLDEMLTMKVESVAGHEEKTL